MRKLVVTSKFKRALKKFVNRNASLQQQVEKTLLQMTEDIFAPSLMSHRLKGEYEGLRACSCGYDCRIIFSIEKNHDTNEEEIVLLNVGSHDEVY
jgi:mRNA interferase YafQ